LAGAVNVGCGTKIDNMDRLLFVSDEYVLAVEIQMDNVLLMDSCQDTG
jgi:hypothetical protein